MSQSKLVIILIYAAGIYQQTHFDAFFWLGIVDDYVFQAVFQSTHNHALILG